MTSGVTTNEAVDSVLARVDDLREEMVARLSEAVKIRSINPAYPGQDYDALVGGEAEAAAFMAEIYRELGGEVDVFSVAEGRDHAVAVFRGEGGGKSLILNGHIDVVPGGKPENWSDGDPFSGRVDGDRLWGRGSSDMKSGVIAQAFAVRALRDCGVKLKGDLILEAVPAEETGEHDIGVNATIERGYKADGAVVAEPSRPPVPLAIQPVSAGAMWFSVTVEGKAGHCALRSQMIRPGHPIGPHGVGAIDKAFLIYSALEKLETYWGQTKQHPLFEAGHFCLLPGVIAGSPHGVDVPFIAPEYTRIDYVTMYPPDETAEEITAEISEHVERAAQMDPWLREHPPVVEVHLVWPPNHPDDADDLTAQMVAAQERAAIGTPFEGPATVNGCTAAEDTTYLTLGGVPAISYGPGDMSLAHGDDEFVFIDEVVCAARAFAVLAMNWCEVARSDDDSASS